MTSNPVSAAISRYVSQGTPRSASSVSSRQLRTSNQISNIRSGGAIG